MPVVEITDRQTPIPFQNACVTDQVLLPGEIRLSVEKSDAFSVLSRAGVLVRFKEDGRAYVAIPSDRHIEVALDGEVHMMLLRTFLHQKTGEVVSDREIAGAVELLKGEGLLRDGNIEDATEPECGPIVEGLLKFFSDNPESIWNGKTRVLQSQLQEFAPILKTMNTQVFSTRLRRSRAELRRLGIESEVSHGHIGSVTRLALRSVPDGGDGGDMTPEFASRSVAALEAIEDVLNQNKERA